MKVKLISDAQFCGHEEQIIELQSVVTEDDIKAMFPVTFGIPYDDNCSYEVIEGKLTNIEEILAYTE